MRFREDFVTNSSSTSYIIAVKEDKVNPRDRIYFKYLMDYCEDYNDTSSSTDVTFEAVNPHNKENKFIELYDDENIFDIMPDEVELVSKGFKLYHKEVDYSDSLVTKMLHAFEDNSDGAIQIFYGA